MKAKLIAFGFASSALWLILANPTMVSAQPFECDMCMYHQEWECYVCWPTVYGWPNCQQISCTNCQNGSGECEPMESPEANVALLTDGALSSVAVPSKSGMEWDQEGNGRLRRSCDGAILHRRYLEETIQRKRYLSRIIEI